MARVLYRRFGASRSFPDTTVSLPETLERSQLDVDVYLGRPPEALTAGDEVVTLIELGTECLGVYTGECRGREGSRMLGFARHRLGKQDPSSLVEIVRQPSSDAAAVDTARELFEKMGFTTATCADFPGRIIDRLVRPYFNSALAALDEGLASADDLDITLQLGLGYPLGPIALLESTGLEDHYRVSADLHVALGEPAYVPARRAAVARRRSVTRDP
jgi:3-hydroxybutyryl-CoA dehydrogenase